jgi:hypothetical protein
MGKRLVFAAFVYLFANSAAPQTTEPAIPPELKDWRGWVLKDLDYRACPFLANETPNRAEAFVCAWPGSLNLDAAADGARFHVRWRVEAPTFVPLPGDAEHWPQQVTVNGQRQAVVGRDGAPWLWLTAGSYDVAGHIPWRERPQTLRVPARIGLVALGIDGKTIAPVQREGDEVTLGRGTTAAPEADSLQLRVFRKLADGVPAELTTRIELDVAGQAREETFGPVLPEGFVPLSLAATWPARLDDDGRLHVQVQPGQDTLTIAARATTPLTRAVARLAPAPWPRQEIWSYAAAPELRVTVASGKLQVDPRQSGVPADWHEFPAFALDDGATLSIEQRARGLAADEGNRLTLAREAWLDFDGGGWYARDRIGGTMQRRWRFDVAPPLMLERAEALNSRRGPNGGAEPLLVTRGAEPALTGVEWRTPEVNLAAGVRIAGAATLPVAGWQDTFDRVDATLHLPFGYKLLAAPGADGAVGSWMSAWTLLDVFVCAILVLLAARLLGLIGGIAATAYLLLGYQESGAPFASLIGVLALALIARALPAGKLRTAATTLGRIALLLLVLVALPFAADQLRYALYPQLEGGVVSLGMLEQESAKVVETQREADNVPQQSMATPPPPVAPAPAMRAMRPAAAPKAAAETKAFTASTGNRSDLIDHYGESTVTQTGRGEPSWTLGSSARLSWSGPVLVTQDVRLVIAPPWLTRVLRIVLVALLGWLIGRLLGGLAAWPRLGGVRLGIVIAIIAGATALPAARAAEFPSEQLLGELRQRLTEPPKCAPACASLAEARVSASGETIVVALEAQAAERIALPLPAGDAGMMLKSIKVDGLPEDTLLRGANGTPWLTLNRGVHRVDLEYVAFADKLALAFPLRPARVLFSGSGWEAGGLGDDRLLAETLSLTRARGAAAARGSAGAQQFPPYVRVTRHLALGLDWSVSTEVRRLAPAQGGFAVTVPVLAGEHVTTPGRKVENGTTEVAFADGQEAVNWNGTLDKADTFRLTAPPLADHAEVWRVLVSPMWHAQFAGVPETALGAGENASDYREFEFQPLPGETLTLTIARPAAVQGATRAIDAVSLMSDAGQHAATHTLGFTVRASQGGEQTIALPADAEVLAVHRDGDTLNLRPLDGKLTLPLTPGSHRFEVRFREPQPIGIVARTPSVALGLPAANIGIGLALPADRWLLATSGPRVGPAVLYWGELALMILVAFVLSRTGRTRLKFRDWLLLGLGFSTFSWAALVVVVLWLFAFDWRRRQAPTGETAFNLVQIGLALLTLVALLCLVSAIPQGLLGQPAMHVTGNGSSAHSLAWFLDRSADALPQGSAFSVPLWVYKVLMLAWALWLANALIGWLRDAFGAWTAGGYWRAKAPAPTPPDAPKP